MKKLIGFLVALFCMTAAAAQEGNWRISVLGGYENFPGNPYTENGYRLGGEVRLKSAYIVRAESVVKDAEGRIVEIHCTYDPDSLSGSGSEASMRKVKGTLHWVSAPTALEAEVRLYDRLFNDEMPDGHRDHDFKEYLNPDSLKVLTGCKLEPSVARFTVGDRMQFHRLGYFCVDPDTAEGRLVINRTVSLKDTWQKMNK